MPTRSNWKNAAYPHEVKDDNITAKNATIAGLESTDIRVSNIEGTGYLESKKDMAESTGNYYGSSEYAGLTISAEAISYTGGTQLPDLTISGGTILEQYIQPMSFANSFDNAEEVHGVVGYAAQREKGVSDSSSNISAFGLFGAPGENVVLTVSELDGGMYNYLKGSNQGELATGKTGIFIDPSNRVFMGVNGKELYPGGLDLLVKGSDTAQLYVKGDIIVDGSGVQVEKYLVDDMFIGSSVAIMGNQLSSNGMINDISLAVPNLENYLTHYEQENGNQGYLFVANTTKLFADLNVSGGVTVGSGNNLDNSGQWINGIETLQINTPFVDDNPNHLCAGFTSNVYKDGIESKDNLACKLQHAIYDGKDSALLLEHSYKDPSGGQTQGTLIFLKTTEGAETVSGDVLGAIQFRGVRDINDGISGAEPEYHQFSSASIQSRQFDTSKNNLIMKGHTIGLKANSDSGIDEIVYGQVSSGDGAALAVIETNASKSRYYALLDSNDWAIPTAGYVQRTNFWDISAAAPDTLELNVTVNPDVKNVDVVGTFSCQNILCPQLEVPAHFKTICHEEALGIWPFIYYAEVDCHTVEVPGKVYIPITDFSANVFFRGQMNALYYTSDVSMTNNAFGICPYDNGSAGMTIMSRRASQANGPVSSTIWFGNAIGSNNDDTTTIQIGSIEGEMEATQSVGNMRFYGSDENGNLVNFLSYIGGTPNELDISAGDVSITLPTGGLITKSTFTQATDPSNSLVDLSYVSSAITQAVSNAWTISSGAPTIYEYSDPSANNWVDGTASMSYVRDRIKTFDPSYAVVIEYEPNVSGQSLNNPCSLENAGLIVKPKLDHNNDGAISILGKRNFATLADEPNYTSQILLGNHDNGQHGGAPGAWYLGAIRCGVTDHAYNNKASNVGNIQLCGSHNGRELVPFIEYIGEGNRIDISATSVDIDAGDVSITLPTGGVITKSTFTQPTDPSNSLVDLSYVSSAIAQAASNAWTISSGAPTIYEYSDPSANNWVDGTASMSYVRDRIKTFDPSYAVVIEYEPNVSGQSLNNPCSLENAGLIVKPKLDHNNDGAISIVGRRNFATLADEPNYTAQILLGNRDNGQHGGASGAWYLGAIRCGVTDHAYNNKTSNVGNIQLCGSYNGRELVPFMEYIGEENRIDISATSVDINRKDGTDSILSINDFTDIPSSSFAHNSEGTASRAILSLKRSNGQDPSSNPTGPIAEINFEGYANGLSGGPGISPAASIKCYNAGEAQDPNGDWVEPTSQGQNGFLTINAYDNSGNSDRDAIQLDNEARVYINARKPTYTTKSDGGVTGVEIYSPSTQQFRNITQPHWGGYTPNLTCYSNTDLSYSYGVIAAEGGYLTGVYATDSSPDYFMADVSFVKHHTSTNGSNWDVSTNNTTLVLKSSSITVVEAPSFNATSDVAKKENIQTISGALESINELRGVTYNLKADEANKTHHGVIAQELEEIFPDMVAGEEGSKSVAYMEIIGVLVEAVKDLKKRVEELESK